ncbi:hypothetical protein QAD02_004591 [Eretmocerus hayati]|uniref:Uncharacterized protein n=1 Tax=Eretmocerus hayati TaxID=131215 RepID=A0ACC2NQ01_9HYME|nr:hypothetical protein QAD02_004591 [Eretmocerus hayati]
MLSTVGSTDSKTKQQTAGLSRPSKILERYSACSLKGVPKDALYVLYELSKITGISFENICLTLKKIRQNHVNATLAYDFGYSDRHVARIFESTVPVSAQVLKKVIFWPSKIRRSIEMHHCKIVVPCTVKAGEKCSEEHVRRSKEIASCRIHVERVIRRIQEFKFLDMNTCVDNKNIYFLDDIVIIAGALVDLQGRIIKK